MDDRDSANNDLRILVSADLLDASNSAKKQLDDLSIAYESMLQNYNNLKGMEGFEGKAAKGFLELFDIILQFHKDLLDRSPAIYTSIDHGFERLADFTNDPKYRSL